MKVVIILTTLLILSSCDMKIEEDNAWLDYGTPFQLINPALFTVTSDYTYEGDARVLGRLEYTENFTQFKGNNLIATLRNGHANNEAKTVQHYLFHTEFTYDHDILLNDLDSVALIEKIDVSSSNPIFSIIKPYYTSLFISNNYGPFELVTIDHNKAILNRLNTNIPFRLRWQIGLATGINAIPNIENTMTYKIQLSLKAFFTN